jgi:hypothetical protein
MEEKITKGNHKEIERSNGGLEKNKFELKWPYLNHYVIL